MKNTEKTFTVEQVISILEDMKNDLQIYGRQFDLNHHIEMSEYENYGNSFTLEADISSYDVTTMYTEIADDYIEGFARDSKLTN
jgi:hypothetical protein